MATRRTFVAGALAGGLLSIVDRGGLAQSVGAEPVEVLRRAVHLGRRLKAGEITPARWQEAIDSTLRSCSVADFRAALDLDRLREEAGSVPRGASIIRAPFVRELGGAVGSDVKVFFLERGRSDPPHCHFNMVAAHIVLEGSFRVRHFERVREERGGVVLRPSGDRVIGPGELTSITDERDNAHWHLAESDGVLLDVQQGRLDPSVPIRRRQMLDVDRGVARADGTLLAPRLGRATALRRYG